AQEQALVRDRIQDDAESALLVVAAGNVAIESIADRRDKKNHDRGVTLPFLGLSAFDALAVIERHEDESRDHQNPDESDLIRRRHGRLGNMLSPWPKKKA